MMQALISIYAVTIIASCLLGAGLALLGVQLAARDRAMQTMCVSQGAMLGVLLGIGIFATLSSSDLVVAAGPFALGLTMASLTAYCSERLAASGGSSNNTHFAALFALLLACGYLISALFPMLESHMAQKYFGDLATLGHAESLAAIAVGLVVTATMTRLAGPITRDSFRISILGTKQEATPTGRLFAVGSLLVLCFCIQTVGFLFTVACLFIPTSLLSFGSRPNLRLHLVCCALVAAVSTVVGFIASLAFSHLPTVPTIIAVMTIVAGLTAQLRHRI